MERGGGGGGDTETKEEALKSTIAIRCVKALHLLSSLKNSQNHQSINSTTTDGREEEREDLLRTISDLKIRLLIERFKYKEIKCCSLMEFFLQIVILLSLMTVLLMFAFGFFH